MPQQGLLPSTIPFRGTFLKGQSSSSWTRKIARNKRNKSKYLEGPQDERIGFFSFLGF